LLIWIIRSLVLIASPLISYFYVSATPKGIGVGIAFALSVILIEYIVQLIPLDTIIAALLGAVFGLIGAKLIDYMVFLAGHDQVYAWVKEYSILIKIILVYLGMVIAVNKKSELELLDQDIFNKKRKWKKATEVIILDTSAIIDGRIIEVVETRFLSGVFVVARFVLDELQKLADHSDTFKRNRARRGLDIIARLQKEESISVKIFDKDYPDLSAVDAKIVQLAKDLGAKVVTTDFNLNKIASLQNVVVLNINDLSNALKPVYLPGEEIHIFLVKEGKERNQGVGYLDDGTMIVIEEGNRHIGKRVSAMVNSILQTSSGRMVFARYLADSVTQTHAEK